MDAISFFKNLRLSDLDEVVKAEGAFPTDVFGLARVVLRAVASVESAIEGAASLLPADDEELRHLIDACEHEMQVVETRRLNDLGGNDGDLPPPDDPGYLIP